jgi:hypothetical protein
MKELLSCLKDIFPKFSSELVRKGDKSPVAEIPIDKKLLKEGPDPAHLSMLSKKTQDNSG